MSNKVSDGLLSLVENIKFVKDLNFTNEEIEFFLIKILEINNNELLCKQNKEHCCLEDSLHEYFYRNEKNVLKTSYKYCDKKDNHKLNDYVIYDYENKNKQIKFNKEFISVENQNFEFRKEIIKTLKKQLKNNELTSLYLHGNVGVGKTYIITALCNSLIEYNKTICYINTNKLFNIFNKENDLLDNFYNIIDDMKKCDLLVLDDFGIESFLNWFHIGQLLPVLNYRNIENKPIYFLSNFNLDKLKLRHQTSYTKYSNRNEFQSVIIEKFIDEIRSIINKNEINLQGYNWRKSN